MRTSSWRGLVQFSGLLVALRSPHWTRRRICKANLIQLAAGPSPMAAERELAASVSQLGRLRSRATSFAGFSRPRSRCGSASVGERPPLSWASRSCVGGPSARTRAAANTAGTTELAASSERVSDAGLARSRPGRPPLPSGRLCVRKLQTALCSPQSAVCSSAVSDADNGQASR